MNPKEVSQEVALATAAIPQGGRTATKQQPTNPPTSRSLGPLTAAVFGLRHLQPNAARPRLPKSRPNSTFSAFNQVVDPDFPAPTTDPMLHIFAYFLASYTLISVAGVCLVAAAKKIAVDPGTERPRFRHPGWIVPVLCLAALLPLSPYALVEAQTRLHLPSLQESVIQALQELNGDPAFKEAKVLSITPHSCRVYVVTPCPADSALGPGWRGEVLRFSHSGTGWKLTDFDGIWSDCGSASGNIFPPYLSKGDYR